MGEPATTYDDDIVLWAERQAAVLRELRRGRVVPNELDIENVAEEIETVGRNEVRAAESFVRLIFVHLLKAVSAPDASALGHWKTEVIAWHQDLIDVLTPSMMQRIDVDGLWRRAQRQARVTLEEDGAALAEGLPERAPLSLAELAAEDFDVGVAVDRILALRST